MELWIRTQSRGNLLKVNDVFIHNDNNQLICANFIPINEFHDSYIELGVYNSKKRALEVLDEIQNLLMPKYKINTYRFENTDLLDGTKFIQPILDDIEIQSAESYVYVMPEE